MKLERMETERARHSMADIAAIYKLPRGVDILRSLLPEAEEYRRMEEEASRLRAQIARLTDKLNDIKQQLKRPLNKEE